MDRLAVDRSVVYRDNLSRLCRHFFLLVLQILTDYCAPCTLFTIVKQTVNMMAVGILVKTQIQWCQM